MILFIKYAPPQVGFLTVKTIWFMVSQEKDGTYKILYKTENGYRGIYNVLLFEVHVNGKT